MSVAYLPIPGTHGWRGVLRKTEWWCPDSPFALFMQGEGFTRIGAEEPFVWSTDIDAFGSMTDWRAGGFALKNYLRPFRATDDTYVDINDRNLIAHSHGLQVVLFACAGGLKVARLISVGAPVRRDMAPIAAAARPNIGAWLHLYSDCTDRWQWLGELFDGHLGIVRAHPLADRNERIPRAGHGGLLRDAERFALWKERQWLAFLRA
jgi:hypothetical protein